MNKIVASCLASLAVFAFSSANAKSSKQQVEMCAGALASNGSTAAAEYRAKFKKSRGGSVKTLTIDLVPLSGGEKLTGICKIKGGKITEAAIKN